MDTKLTVRVPRRLLENAKRYASNHHITLTDLISTFLQDLPSSPQSLEDAPITRRVTGLLSPDLSLDDYQKHLEEKYG